MKVQYAKKIEPVNALKESKRTEKQLLKDVYDSEYQQVYLEERAKYLKEKAAKDAKQKAKQDGIIDTIKHFLTGGRE